MIYYLKCDHCGHHNEVKSEYLVFCENCNKKITSNYGNWKLENAGSTFEDFKSRVCLSEKQTLEAAQIPSKPARSYPTRRIILLILVIAIGSFGGIHGPDIFNAIFNPSLEKMLHEKWTAQTYGSMGLRIESPIELNLDYSIDKKIPQEVTGILISTETFLGELKKKRLHIMANSFRYRPDVTGSLEKAAEGSVNEMRSRPGITGFTFDNSPISRNGIRGYLIKGKWVEKNKVIGYRVAVFVEKNLMWQVVVGFDFKDPAAHKVADKIIRSIEINKNSV